MVLDAIQSVPTARSYFGHAALQGAMPEGTVEFLVAAPVERVWSFLSDLHQVGRCIPGVENIRVLDGTHAQWDLAVKVGPLSQAITMTTETLEQVPLQRGRFRGRAENIEMTGTIELAPVEGGTKVAYRVAVNAKGPFSRIMNGFIRTRVKSETEAFAARVKKELET